MTSPISLLLPLNQGEQPAAGPPADDPALFGAMLTAALHAGAVAPAQLPVVTIVPLEPEPPVAEADGSPEPATGEGAPLPMAPESTTAPLTRDAEPTRPAPLGGSITDDPHAEAPADRCAGLPDPAAPPSPDIVAKGAPQVRDPEVRPWTVATREPHRPERVRSGPQETAPAAPLAAARPPRTEMAIEGAADTRVAGTSEALPHPERTTSTRGRGLILPQPVGQVEPPRTQEHQVVRESRIVQNPASEVSTPRVVAAADDGGLMPQRSQPTDTHSAPAKAPRVPHQPSTPELDAPTRPGEANDSTLATRQLVAGIPEPARPETGAAPAAANYQPIAPAAAEREGPTREAGAGSETSPSAAVGAVVPWTQGMPRSIEQQPEPEEHGAIAVAGGTPPMPAQVPAERAAIRREVDLPEPVPIRPAEAFAGPSWARERGPVEPAAPHEAGSPDRAGLERPAAPIARAFVAALGDLLQGATISEVRVVRDRGAAQQGDRIMPPDDAAGARALPPPRPDDDLTAPSASRVVGRTMPVIPRLRDVPQPERAAPEPPAPDRPAPRAPGAASASAADVRWPSADLPGFEPAGRTPDAGITARRANLPMPTLPSDRQDLPARQTGAPDGGPDHRRWAETDAASASDSVVRGSPSSGEQAARGTGGDSVPRDVPAREAHNLREGWLHPERPAVRADRVTLQIADAEGRQTRIRVALVGDQVRATILPPDAQSARQLEQRMDELQAALARQGFVDAKVTVQASRPELTVPWAGMPGPSGADLPSSSGTEQPSGDLRQGTGRRDEGRQGDGQRHPHQRPRERDPNDRRRQ